LTTHLIKTTFNFAVRLDQTHMPDSCAALRSTFARDVETQSTAIPMRLNRVTSAHPRCLYAGTTVATMGAILALVAPFIGCYVGFGDDIDVSSDCVEEGTSQIACFEYNTLSISCILTTPNGGAAFAAGISVYYSVYTRTVIRFLNGDIMSYDVTTSTFDSFISLRRVLCLLFALECIGMMMTSLVPMVTHIQYQLHLFGFCLWIGSGIVSSGLMAARMYTHDIRVPSRPVPVRMLSLMTWRTVFAILLTVLCIVSATTRESTGPLFRISEYALLLLTTTTGLAFVLNEADERGESRDCYCDGPEQLNSLKATSRTSKYCVSFH
jgi:hypothetical protein